MRFAVQEGQTRGPDGLSHRYLDGGCDSEQTMVGTTCHLPSPLCMEDEPCRPTAERECVSELVTRVIFEWGRRFAFHGFLSLQVNFTGGGCSRRRSGSFRLLCLSTALFCRWLVSIAYLSSSGSYGRFRLVRVGGATEPVSMHVTTVHHSMLSVAPPSPEVGDGRSFNNACDSIVQVKKARQHIELWPEQTNDGEVARLIILALG